MAKLYYIAPIEFECSDNPITVGDNKQQRECPHDGEILGSDQFRMPVRAREPTPRFRYTTSIRLGTISPPSHSTE